jgi:hypothetical protein
MKTITQEQAVAIRDHLDHRKGTRWVMITRVGTVHIIGSADELDHDGWRFAGYAEEILCDIAHSKASAIASL